MGFALEAFLSFFLETRFPELVGGVVQEGPVGGVVQDACVGGVVQGRPVGGVFRMHS